MFRRHLRTEPVSFWGDEFHDIDIVVAAKKVIVTCEELVSNDVIRRDPTLTKIPLLCS